MVSLVASGLQWLKGVDLIFVSKLFNMLVVVKEIMMLGKRRKVGRKISPALETVGLVQMSFPGPASQAAMLISGVYFFLLWQVGGFKVSEVGQGEIEENSWRMGIIPHLVNMVSF